MSTKTSRLALFADNKNVSIYSSSVRATVATWLGGSADWLRSARMDTSSCQDATTLLHQGPLPLLTRRLCKAIGYPFGDQIPTLRMTLFKQATQIQSCWRSYKTRKTVNKFKYIGTDAWSIVLKHIDRRNKIPLLLRSHTNVYVLRARFHMQMYTHFLYPQGRHPGETEIQLAKEHMLKFIVSKDSVSYFERLSKCY